LSGVLFSSVCSFSRSPRVNVCCILYCPGGRRYGATWCEDSASSSSARPWRAQL
jgi:hypothetical protein